MILLAAGNASRMGFAKQLLDFHGRPLVRHAAETALASTCRPVWVVVGARAKAVRDALKGLPIEIVENADWESGMGSSITAGVRAAIERAPAGVVIALADQPLIGAELYDRLVEHHRQSACPVVASGYAGTAGVPAFFAAELYPALLSLPPEQGCRRLLQERRADVAVLPCPEAEVDLDCPEDVRRLQE